MRSISTRRLAGSRMRLRIEHAFERAVVLGALHAARILGVGVLDQLVVVGIQIDLADIGDVCPSASWGIRRRSRRRAPSEMYWPTGELEHHFAGLLRRDQIDDRALAGEDAARGEGDGGGEAGAARRFDAAVGGLSSSADLSQLVVCGRSSGPRAGGVRESIAAAAAVASCGGGRAASAAAGGGGCRAAPRPACPRCSGRRSGRDRRSVLRPPRPWRRRARRRSRRPLQSVRCGPPRCPWR